MRKTFFFVVIFAVINILFAKIPILSFLKWLTVFKLILLATYIKTSDVSGLKKIIFQSLSSSVVFFSAIGIAQFFLQNTIGGPLYFLGERSFSVTTPGIALVDLFGKNFMRTYSTFSHPNSLAGFLFVSVLIILGLGKQRAFWFAAPLLAFVLSFSLGAFLGIALTVILVLINKKIIIALPMVLIIVSFLIGLLPGKYFLNNESFQERLLLTKNSLRIFSSNPVVGVGLNNSIALSGFIQPVHNIFLLTTAETGIIGLLLLFVFFVLVIRKTRNKYFLLALIFVLVSGTVDHYWFTLQQNQLLLALLFGIVFRDGR